MKSRLASAVLASLVLVAPGQEARPIRIAEVVIAPDGPMAMQEEALRARIRSRAGSNYSPEAVHDDIRALYDTNRFSDVRVDLEPVGANEVRVVFRVREKPILTEILVEGARAIKASEIRNLIGIAPGEPLDEARIFAGLDEVRVKYGKRGYPDIRLEHETSIDPETRRAVVRVVVEEGRRYRVKAVRFEGNRALTQRQLRKAMRTRRYGIFSWLLGTGRYMPEQLEEDLRAVRALYRDKGYVDVELGEPRVEREGGRVTIVVPVTEGTLYRVGSISIEGNTILATDELMGGLAMGEGSTFSPPGERKDLGILRDAHESRGYLGTEVMTRRFPNVETGRIDLTYTIREGELTTIDLIDIRGNTITRDRVIRRELAIRPGELYDGPKVRASEQRLRNLGYFDSVESFTEPTDAPDRRNMVFEVEEGRTGQLMLGAGYSSIDQLIGIVEVQQGNFDLFNPPLFRGAGQKLRLRVQAGSKREDYLLSFVEPWFLNRRLSLGTDLYRRENRYASGLYEEKRTGGRLTLGRALTEYLRGEIYYNYERVQIGDVAEAASDAIKAEAGTRDVSLLGTGLTYDTRDSVLRPTRGMRNTLHAEIAGGLLGADTDFYRLREVNTSFHPVPWFEDHVLAIQLRAGVVEEYGDSDRVPLSERFFLGGPYTVRGFKYRAVGPKDENGEPIGGRTMAMASFEYLVPIVPMIRGAVFYDAGMVWEEAWKVDSNLNSGAGLGVRFDLPIGPIRLDYAWPIDTDEFNDDPNGRLHFSFSYGF